jgi:hypothetical protein
MHRGPHFHTTCGYNVGISGSTATLTWVPPPPVCTPGEELACCPFARGCGCDGIQACKSDGSGFGPCVGATLRGHECN